AGKQKKRTVGSESFSDLPSVPDTKQPCGTAVLGCGPVNAAGGGEFTAEGGCATSVVRTANSLLGHYRKMEWLARSNTAWVF
ncbi:MAG TPA: hypothetical protein VF306_03170, partial [Pirellulales bacterium]